MNYAHNIDLLVSYSWGCFVPARQEIVHVLRGFGDPDPTVERTAVLGIAIVHTCLDNRSVIRKCRELHHAEPLGAFRFAIKWVPVDHWSDRHLDSIKRVIDEKLRDRIEAGQTWGMKVKKRRWQEYHTAEIVQYLAADIDRKVDLNNPDWIVWVDVVGRTAAISLLRPDDIFSRMLPHF